MRKFKKFTCLLVALAILFSLAMPAMAADEIRIPIAIEIPYEVAGVELEVTHTEGLTFAKWEKSSAIRGAGYVDNVSNKGYADTGILKAGIFAVDNRYVPDENGVLDLGYLVFTGTTAGQSITVQCAEFIHVVSKTETENGLYAEPVTINLPRSSSATIVFGGEMSGDVSDSSDSVTLLPEENGPIMGEGPVKVTVDGDAAYTNDEVSYTIAVENATGLATANFIVELDAALIENPVADPADGWKVIQETYTEENGKLVADILVFNQDGVASDKAVDVVTITAETKDEEGNVACTVTDALLSGYTADGEDFIAADLSDASLTTTVTEAEEGGLGGLFPFIIGGAAGGSPIALPFTDVPEGAWYYDSVASAWTNDLIDGVTATLYMPDKTLTVAEAIKLAAVLYQKDNEGTVTLANGSPKWYTTYVDYAVENGIIEAAYKNYTDAQMNAAVTRAEFVHIFHGAMDNYYVINAVGDNNIPDVKLGDYAADEIYEFYRAGICIGNDKYGTFLPNNSIKRSEVATILNRMYDLDAREIVHLP